MLVHLSATSPYACDISFGPIEPANRMSSESTKRSLLEMKESFVRLQPVRTSLKLLARNEIPLDTNVVIIDTTMTTDMHTTLRTSLQPVWYTEQTIVDDNIEQQPSTNIPSSLSEFEKDNYLQYTITSAQEAPRHHLTEPSDESFRALEHLFELGSAKVNVTVTTTAQESSNSLHESLSLTIVTPMELINQTTTSLHLSHALAGDSLLSFQNILLMPTIESIIEPSISSTLPPLFVMDNSETEETSSTTGTIIHPNSLHLTDDNDDEGEETLKDNINNFLFERNNLANNSSNVPTPLTLSPPMITVPAPINTNVAYRALIKSRTGGRISQPVKNPSPLIKALPAHSSVPNLISRILRTSTRQVSVNATIDEANPSTSEAESFVNETKTVEDYSSIEPMEVVGLPEHEEIEFDQNAEITFTLTEIKEIDPPAPTGTEEADRTASSTCSSYVSIPQEATMPIDSGKTVLSREFTYNTPTTRSIRSSKRRRSIFIHPQHVTKLLIPVIPEQQQSIITKGENIWVYSSSSSTNSILSPLSNHSTTISEAPPIILQKSLADSASPSPKSTPASIIHPNDRLSSSLSPRRSIHPLHSSTPSTRNKALEIVFIGELEQLSTTVLQQPNLSLTTSEVTMIDNRQHIDIPLPILHVADAGIQTSPEKAPVRIDMTVQTTPTLHAFSRRCFQTIEQQTTPVLPRTSYGQTTPMAVHRFLKESSLCQQQQVTPLHSNVIVHLRRSVRFQFTPSTDARLAAKEKLEEGRQRRRTKQKIQIIIDNEQEEDTEDEMSKIEKKFANTKKKKVSLPPAPVDDSTDEMNDSPVVRTTRNKSRKDAIEIPVISTTTYPRKTRSTRKEKKVEPEIIVTTTTSPPIPTKRASRKRSNPKISTTSSPKTSSPAKPMAKRSKTLEVKRPIRVPSPEPTPRRNRSEIVERAPLSRKSKKTCPDDQSDDHPVNDTRKNPSSTMKKEKRRLHSVQRDESLNTADEEEIIQTVVFPPLEERISIGLSPEEREKIERFTVVELKNRLNAYRENVPKGARKADLVDLLIQIETKLLKERKAVRTVDIPANQSSRKIRGKK